MCVYESDKGCWPIWWDLYLLPEVQQVEHSSDIVKQEILKAGCLLHTILHIAGLVPLLGCRNCLQWQLFPYTLLIPSHTCRELVEVSLNTPFVEHLFDAFS